MDKLIPKNQLASRALKTRLQIRDEQQLLWDAGAFKGVLHKGRQITKSLAIDGLDGKLTNQARENFKNILTKKFTTPIILSYQPLDEFISNATAKTRKILQKNKQKAKTQLKKESLQQRKTKVPFKDSALIKSELLKMWDAGAFDGILVKGKPITYKQAVDGIDGKNTNLARKNYKEKTQSSRNSIAYTVHPLFGFPLNVPMKASNELVPEEVPMGDAYYISYPNHKISTSGTGLEDVFGKNIPVIQGHAGSIIVDDKGNATYHYYGRYGDKGSYHSKMLPKRNSGEDHDAYLKRIRTHLEYANQGEAVTAVHIPNVNSKKARDYYRARPNTGKYNLTDGTTCAGEACAGIDAGLGENSSSFLDWLLPDTPENIRRNYSRMRGTTTYNF